MCQKEKNNFRSRKKIEKDINNLEAKLKPNTRDNIDLLENIQALKDELQRIRQEKIKRAIIRAKAEDYYNFEKPTKYFCNLEKRNYINKVVHRLRFKNNMVTNQNDILEIVKNFYSDLLQSKRPMNSMQNHEYFLSDTNINSLSNQDKMLCEGLVNKAELLQVLKSMKNGKSPGTDGFTSAFYKFFWVDIGNEVLKRLNEAFYTGELSTTQKQGIITLLPKNN